MNIKQELLGRLKEVLLMEGKANAMYTEIKQHLENESMKEFFEKMAEEEKVHSRIINELIGILEEAHSS